MERTIQLGDLAVVNDHPFIIRQISNEGIYISSELDSDQLSLLINQGGNWQVYLFNVPHTVRFEIAPDNYFNLPPEMIRKIAFNLNTNEINNLCLTSQTFNQTICNDDYFWN